MWVVLSGQTAFGAPRAAIDAAREAHEEIWRRFIDRHGVMLDFTGLDGRVSLPTPEECRLGRPNALGWWSPIENGPMFSGTYLEMMVHRWEQTREAADAAKIRRLVEGLLLMNSVSETPGFIARGVSTDGRSHFAMGSDDQTIPWFLGLWRFHQSDLATGEERRRVRRHFVGTAEALAKLDWRVPAEAPFGRRGSFAGFEFDGALRRLFILRAVEAVTGEGRWGDLYRAALRERGGEKKLSRLEIAGRGLRYWYSARHNWTSASSVGCLRGLWEMESDPGVKAAFARGLVASAALAAQSLSLAEQYDPEAYAAFDPDWRFSMLRHWRPQQAEGDATAVASAQLRTFLEYSPQRRRESAFVREPAAAAWIVALCPDAEGVRPHRARIEGVLSHYDYARLHYCTFFWLEGAWWRLRSLD